MPSKHNAGRRRIPQARYRVRNRREHEAGLRRRGDLTLRPDEAVMAGRPAPQRTTPGGRAQYSDLAIEPVPMPRLVFRLAPRQVEGFAAGVLRLLGQGLQVPGRTNHPEPARPRLRRPQARGRAARSHASGIGSTGLKLFGRGERDAEEHGRARPSWRESRLAVDAGTGEIIASVLTGQRRRRRRRGPGAA